jgi:hypothetical protein
VRGPSFGSNHLGGGSGGGPEIPLRSFLAKAFSALLVRSRLYIGALVTTI